MKKIYTAKKKPQHLGIVSDAHHYRGKDGTLYVLAPVARQFEQWAELFPRVTVCAPLLSGAPPSTHSAYRNPQIRLLPIALAGGDGMRAKAHLISQVFRWARALNRLFNTVDAVHVRCPNNVSVVALLLLQLRRLPREAVYTGNWQPAGSEPFFYRWQRQWLRNRFRGPVAAYGAWPQDPPHIVETFSPSYSAHIWQEEREQVAQRVATLRSQSELSTPIRLTTVGWLSATKNQRVSIQVVRALRDLGQGATLILLGEGAERDNLVALARELNVERNVIFHGHAGAEKVRQTYRECDFLLQPTTTEGYTKVAVEAFFHGCVPVLSDVSINWQIVGAAPLGDAAHNIGEVSSRQLGARGAVFPLNDAQNAAALIAQLAQRPALLADCIEAQRAYAMEHTLEAWREHLRQMLSRFWKVTL